MPNRGTTGHGHEPHYALAVARAAAPMASTFNEARVPEFAQELVPGVHLVTRPPVRSHGCGVKMHPGMAAVAQTGRT